MELTYDPQGLIVAIAQDHLSGQIRMVGWMNREAFARTVQTGRATFYSRSRRTLWEKGESSGNVLHVRGIFTDCDADSLLLMVEPVGPTCHTGKEACFFRELSEGAWRDGEPAIPFLGGLERELAERQRSTEGKSYTKSLLVAGAEKIGAKVREEAAEFAAAIAGESDERVASEGADVVYHLLVGLLARTLPFRRIVGKLAERSGVSGHQEKSARMP